MKVIRIAEPGGPDVLELADRPTPEPGPGHVRVRVAAAGLNRADLLQRRGRYPAPPGWPADVPGLEYAGVVDAAGDGVTTLSVGDRVMGLVGGGAYAERVVVHERAALRVPEPLSVEEAAAVPEAYITAHDALFARGRLAPGETVLVHAVGGGVGIAALQLARHAGARVLGTSRTPKKLRAAAELGLDVGIEVAGDDRETADGSRRSKPSETPRTSGTSGRPRFAERVREVTGGAGADLVLDLVGGHYVAEDLDAVRTTGRIVLVGLLAGARVDLDLGAVLRRRIALVGTVLRSRPLEEKIDAVRRAAVQLLPLLESGTLRPVVDRTFPMEQAAEAHRFMESNASFGKIVLCW